MDSSYDLSSDFDDDIEVPPARRLSPYPCDHSGLEDSPLSISTTIMTKPSASTKGTQTSASRSTAQTHHPPTSQMVISAIKNQTKGRGGGVSLQAIKKYISDNYEVDLKKTAPLIRKFLTTAVGEGKLKQISGHGANGSFKLAPDVTAQKKAVGGKKAKAEKSSSKNISGKKASKKNTPKPKDKKPRVSVSRLKELPKLKTPKPKKVSKMLKKRE